ncbi:RICIN domain-containing protein [Kribbella sp. NPDC055071]
MTMIEVSLMSTKNRLLRRSLRFAVGALISTSFLAAAVQPASATTVLKLAPGTYRLDSYSGLTLTALPPLPNATTAWTVVRPAESPLPDSQRSEVFDAPKGSYICSWGASHGFAIACLDVVDGSKSQGMSVVVRPFTGQPSQQWTLEQTFTTTPGPSVLFKVLRNVNSRMVIQTYPAAGHFPQQMPLSMAMRQKQEWIPVKLS